MRMIITNFLSDDFTNNIVLFYMFKYIDLRVFLVTLAIGMLYIYISDEYKHTIIIYPTPDNINEYQFKDKTNNCFSYKMNEVKCPSEDKYHKIKIQT